MYKNKAPSRQKLIKEPLPCRDIVSNQEHSTSGKPNASVYELLWRKKTAKFHKTWEGDGIGTVTRSSGGCDLLVERDDGFKLGIVRLGPDTTCLAEGTILSMGSYEVEVGALVTLKPPTSNRLASESSNSRQGSCSRPTLSPVSSSLMTSSPSNSSVIATPKVNPSNILRKCDSIPAKKVKPNARENSGGDVSIASPHEDRKGQTRPSLGMIPAFKVPSCASTTATQNLSGGNVWIDSNLQLKMRPHQIEGTLFMRDSVLGLRHKYGHGCILADEMGLGKTLTAIALVHTLLKNKEIRNALIVCPVTLIYNWKAEFEKWLDPFSALPVRPRVGVMTIDQNGWGSGRLKDPISAFFGDRHFKLHQVMIVGYERVRLFSSQLIEKEQQFDLLICDEGHRLKTANSKTAESIDSIVGEKRVLLTGTPVQNDLRELWALSNFVNPGSLGSEAKFIRNFVQPISTEFNTLSIDLAHATREGISENDFAFEEEIRAVSRTKDAADESLAQLTELCNEFMLRRTSSVMEKYIRVPKTEYLVFCRPTQRQIAEYAALVGQASDLINSISEGSIDQGTCLQTISELRKCAGGSSKDSGGKMKLLSCLIDTIRQHTDEKLVIVSGSTRVLDMCQQLCANKGVSWLRLDGSTPQDKRQSSVNIFNKTSNKRAFAFLLSSRSGGTGLNLIGGSRLVLMDCDWNPAIDSQVMSRIHRDGQKRTCHIYRLITTGTIDEKIFQRQVSKLELSSSVLLGSSSISKAGFSLEALKDLFTLTFPEKCNTLENSLISKSIKGYQEAAPGSLLLESALENAMCEAGNVSCVLVK